MAKHFGKHLNSRKQKGKPNEMQAAAGIAWYRPETYAQCLAIFDDAADMPDTFDEWLPLAEQTELHAMEQGMSVIRVEINPKTFPQWCAEEGYIKIDSRARSAYSSFMAMRLANQRK